MLEALRQRHADVDRASGQVCTETTTLKGQETNSTCCKLVALQQAAGSCRVPWLCMWKRRAVQGIAIDVTRLVFVPSTGTHDTKTNHKMHEQALKGGLAHRVINTVQESFAGKEVEDTDAVPIGS